MRARIFIGAVLIIAGFGCGIFASGDHRHGTALQWAIAYLLEPALVGSAIVKGPVLFVHDADRMARGEPCTSVRMLEPGPTRSSRWPVWRWKALTILR